MVDRRECENSKAWWLGLCWVKVSMECYVWRGTCEDKHVESESTSRNRLRSWRHAELAEEAAGWQLLNRVVGPATPWTALRRATPLLYIHTRH